MSRLRKFVRRSATEQRLLVAAAVMVPAMRLALWILPFRTLQRIVAGVGQVPDTAPRGARPPPERVAWAVTTAARHLPAALTGTCLTRALAAYALLRRYGHAAELRLGVARSPGGRFRAHAWVQDERGAALFGAAAPGAYAPLPALDRALL